MPRLVGGQKAAALPPLPELPSADDDAGGYVKRVVALVRDAASAVQAVHDQKAGTGSEAAA